VSRVLAPLLLALTACGDPSQTLPTAVFRAERANTGAERYSAWFADSDGRVLYFGLSPFWELWWQSGGDALADLAEPGDHLIGRFDLESERFLEPLRVRRRSPGVRSSVWDVLVHSNGRIYYTTYYEEMGSVLPDGSDISHFDGIGVGFNELVEGPEGNLYVTRYSDAPAQPSRRSYGSVAVLSPDGALLRELRIDAGNGAFVAPKSLAVDPAGGEIWLNTDTFGRDGSVVHEWIRLSADGEVLERGAGSRELLFVAFDPGGRGWFAEDASGELRLRLRERGAWTHTLPLGARDPLDFVQDIRFTARGALLALWSGRVISVEPTGGGFQVADFRLELPAECAPPGHRSLLYTAVPHRDSLYATLFCGPTILRGPLQ
jgi:hypothetical protein